MMCNSCPGKLQARCNVRETWLATHKALSTMPLKALDTLVSTMLNLEL